MGKGACAQAASARALVTGTMAAIVLGPEPKMTHI